MAITPVTLDDGNGNAVFGGTIKATSITLSGTTTNATDAATKSYVDSTVSSGGSSGGAVVHIAGAETITGQKTFTPATDSTSFLQVTKADGTTIVFDVDTTNGRIGIGKVPDFSIAVARSANGPDGGIYSGNGYAVGTGWHNQNTGMHSDGTSLYVGASTSVTIRPGGEGISTYQSNFSTSGVKLFGSIQYTRTPVSDVNYTVLAADYIIAITSLSASRTITLPTAVGIAGRQYVVKDESGSAGTYPVTIATSSSQTIDGASTKSISASYGYVRLYSNGSNWFML